VAARQHACDRKPNLPFLAEDDAADLSYDAIDLLAHLSAMIIPCAVAANAAGTGSAIAMARSRHKMRIITFRIPAQSPEQAA
jgi:hypothetical protein